MTEARSMACGHHCQFHFDIITESGCALCLLGETRRELATLRAEHNRLTDQLAGMVAPEELRQWKAECERLRAEIAWRKGETAKLRLDLEDRESQVQALQQALEESLALNINWTETAEPHELAFFSEYKRVIAMAKAALALPGEAAQQPAGSFGYCAICYHPLDRCSHCDAGEAAQEK